jgi:4-alpha-glucanotransferase
MTAPGRWAGVLLHPTSLPGRYGIGDLGPVAVAFLDWLRRAGQSVWQVLPLGPVDVAGSPYGTTSAFAGNPLLISPERLIEDGLLAPADLEPVPAFSAAMLDVARVSEWKEPLLRRAHERFRALPGDSPLRAEIETWIAAPEQQAWLPDWALFATLKRAHGDREWSSWPEPLRRRDAAALDAARNERAGEVDYETFRQALFARQWTRLRAEAAARGVGILGDLPIYLSGDCADLWARPDLFDLDADGRALRVAGVPPDYFSEDGQLWGNPLYKWERHAAEGYAWWIARLRVQLARHDFLRLDHFRGFQAYWELPAGAATAREGRWVPGPGRALFDAARAALGALPLIAEDLGFITPEVEELRRGLELPGMKVLQFAFGAEGSDHAPHRLTRDTVVYTGTHDNDTTRGWYAALSRDDRRRARAYLGGSARDVAWSMIRAAYTSVAQLAVVPAQDLLALGREARLNTPGVPSGNWSWRLLDGQLTEALADRVRELAAVAERVPSPKSSEPATP